jgi:hypothetical protein
MQSTTKSSSVTCSSKAVILCFKVTTNSLETSSFSSSMSSSLNSNLFGRTKDVWRTSPLHIWCQVGRDCHRITLSLVIMVCNQYIAVPNSHLPPHNGVGRWTTQRRLHQEHRLLRVTDPCTARVKVNSSVMPHQWEVIAITVGMHHQVS